jgi:hypothetical protein
MFTQAVIDKMGESGEILGRDSELIPPVNSIYYRILDTALLFISYKVVHDLDVKDVNQNCDAHG